ncbi:MAG: hypothetical protein B7Y39_02380 [Bdellovibrio sp. 28-41-41]|nr:MAG: hypothetical protein B7Y39_02380 [Bdellovibrio sp. 28-41-41]
MDLLKAYKQYLTLSSELFCSMDLEGTVREPMGPWLDKTGFSIADLIGQNIFKYIHADDIGLLRGAMLGAFTPQNIGLRLRNNTGEAVWFEVTVCSSHENGLFVLRALDISGRIRKDLANSTQTRSLLKEISSIKQRLELAIRAVKFGVWDWNLKSGHIIWDSYMYELFDMTESEFTGEYVSFEGRIVEDDRDALQTQLNETFETRQSDFSSEFRIRDKAGQIKVIKAVGSCFYDSDGKIERMVGNNWDFTSTRDTEMKLKEAHYLALQSAQMATLGEMASGVAHEINNPLAIVQGKARQIDRAIQNENIDVDKIRTDIQKILSTTDRIVKIVKGLRSFSRDSTKDPFDRVWVSSIINEVLDLSSERFKNHGVELRLNLIEDARIQCRGAQIGQVLMNLLSNGHDAVMDGIEPENKWVLIESKKVGDQIVISVMDSGKGIPDEVAKKMMQPFFTTKGVGKGTGLGLSISKGIVEEHLGSLRYDAQSAQTCFVVELPIDYAIKEPDRFRVQIPSHI